MTSSIKKSALLLLLIVSMIIAPLSSFAASTNSIQNFALKSRAGANLVFQWPAVVGATALSIEQKENSGEWTDSTIDGGLLTAASTTATVVGLSPLHSYTFRLAITGGIYEGHSNELTVAIPAVPVSDLAVANVAAKQLDLSWTVPVGATSITLQQSTNGTSWYTAASPL